MHLYNLGLDVSVVHLWCERNNVKLDANDVSPNKYSVCALKFRLAYDVDLHNRY